MASFRQCRCIPQNRNPVGGERERCLPPGDFGHRIDDVGIGAAAARCCRSCEGGLHGVEIFRGTESLDGSDAVTLMHQCQRQARIDPSAVYDHRAGPALAVIAALLSAREVKVSMTATTVDDEEPQLICQEITTERVASIDDALAAIKEGVARTS
jgi:hypothetical protein